LQGFEQKQNIHKGTHMKNFKSLFLSLMVLFLVQNVSAETPQVGTTPAASFAPPSQLTFSPSIWIGARSYLSGLVTANKESNTFGPFLKPGFTVKYDSSPISLTTKYSFETSAAKGFGDANPSKGVADNTYFQHEPIILLTGKANELSKFNLFADLFVNSENKRAQSTYYEFTLQPDFEYQIDPAVSVSVGYQLFRQNYFDSAFTAESASPADFKVAAAKRPGIYAAVSPEVIGQSPLTTVHAGIVTTNVKVGEKSNLTAYFRGGRQTSTISGRDGINYRVNVDLSMPITQNLSTQLRYRYHLEDNDEAAAWYYNRARVILSYAFNKNWSGDVQNQFTLEQKNVDTSQAKYKNENYAGVTYKF
jgi:hypothetical protein